MVLIKHRLDNVESNALWSICMYTYLRNIGPHFFMVSFFSQKLECWQWTSMAFSLLLTRVISCDLDPQERLDIIILFCPPSFISMVANFAQQFLRKGIMEPTLLDVFDCPLTWSCPQVFKSGLGMRLCEGRFDKEFFFHAEIFGISKLFQTHKSFWHRFKTNSFWRNSSDSYGEVIRSDENVLFCFWWKI